MPPTYDQLYQVTLYLYQWRSHGNTFSYSYYFLWSIKMYTREHIFNSTYLEIYTYFPTLDWPTERHINAYCWFFLK